MKTPMNYNTFADEYYWLTQSMVDLKLGIDVLNKLSNMRLKDDDIIKPHTYDSYLLNFTRDFQLADQYATGCIVTYMGRGDCFKKVHVPFNKVMQLGKLVYITPDTETSLHISYRNPLDHDELVRISIQQSKFAAFYNAATHEDFLKASSPAEGEGIYQLSPKELIYQQALFRIIINMNHDETAEL